MFDQICEYVERLPRRTQWLVWGSFLTMCFIVAMIIDQAGDALYR